MTGNFNQKEFLKLLEALARAKGPSLGEGPRRKVLEDFLAFNGVESIKDKAGNLWVTFGPDTWDDAVIYDAHMDVVQEGYIKEVQYRNNRIIGMGVGDNLTAVAMLALLCSDVKSAGPLLKRPLKILFSVGEEGDGNLKGVRQLVNDHTRSPYLFVSFDLSFEEYSVAGLGSRRYELRVECPGGHSWDDYGTPGAVEQLIDFFGLLKNEFCLIHSENAGNLSFNLGSIEGGEGINSIPRLAKARFEFRSVDFKLLSKLDQITKGIIREMNRKKDVTITCGLTGERPAAASVQAERIEPLVRKLLTGVCGTPRPVPRSTNINLPLSAGWPSICLGLCRGGRFHSYEEYVETDSLALGWGLLKELSGALVMNV